MFDSLTGIEIETEYARYLEHLDGSYHSYTFYVTNTPSGMGFENILISLQEDGTYKEFLVHYNLTDDEVYAMNNDTYIVDMEGKVSVAELENSNFSSTAFSRIYYEDGCYHESTFVANTCCEDLHEFGDMSCSFITQGNNACIAQPGGSYQTSIIYCPPGGGGGGGESNPNDPPSEPGDGGSNPPNESAPLPCNPRDPLCLEDDGFGDPEENDPCDELSKLLDTEQINLTPAIIELQGYLDMAPEFGKQLKNENGNFDTPEIPPTPNSKITVVSGEFYYGSIHTHSSHGIPMFSWADVFSLLKFYDNSTSYNRNLTTIILVCKNNQNQNLVYALKINDRDTFAEKIINEVTTIPDVTNMDMEAIQQYLDGILAAYYMSNIDKEHAFLNRFSNYCISIYKANENLTNWSRLKINNENQNEVEPIPCN